MSGGVTNDWVNPQSNNNFGQRFSMSYVTGSHALKVGLQTLQGTYDTNGNALPGGVNYTFRNGAPLTLTQFASPFGNRASLRGYGVFMQDQYREPPDAELRCRHDAFWAYTREFTLPAGPSASARSRR